MTTEMEYLIELNRAATGDDFRYANLKKLAELSKLRLLEQLYDMGYLNLGLA